MQKKSAALGTTLALIVLASLAGRGGLVAQVAQVAPGAPTASQSPRPASPPAPSSSPASPPEPSPSPANHAAAPPPPPAIAPLHVDRAAMVRTMNVPAEPFRIAGNLYSVGTQDVTSYLVATPAGLILLDGGFEETAAQIRDNIARLGFALRDVKILLSSHAHADHVGGLAQLKAWTGAQLFAGADAPLLEAGGRGDFAFGDTLLFPPVAVDHILHDGEAVTLGGSRLVAHATPGHTHGCTTWTLQVADAGKTYDVVIVGSVSILSSYRLVDHPTYPGIDADYAHSLAVLAALPCDIFLGSHTGFFDGVEKARRLRAGAAANPFVDPAGYRAYVASARAAYDAEIARERSRS